MVLRGLADLRPTQKAIERIGHSLLVAAQGMRQVGDALLSTELIVDHTRDLTQLSLSLESQSKEGEGEYMLLIAVADEAYRFGVLPRELYIFCRRLQLIRQHGASYGSLESTLMSAENMMLSYEFDKVDSLRKAHLYFGEQEHFGRTAVWGDLLSVFGQSLAAQARWAEADEIFTMALDAYDSHPGDTDCFRGKLALLASIAATLIEANVESNYLRAQEILLEGIRLLEAPGQILYDPLLHARLKNTKAKLAMMRFILEGSPGLNDQCLREYREADELYKQAAAIRFRSEVLYDRSCHAMVYGSHRGLADSIRSTLRLVVAETKDLDEVVLFLDCRLALVKLNLIQGRYIRRDIRRCLNVAWRYRDHCHLPARYADALATAYVASIYCRVPVEASSRLRISARNASIAANKLNRFESLSLAVDEKRLNPTVLLVP